MPRTAVLPAPGAERDLRDPSLRLQQLFDDNNCEPLNAVAEDSEVLTAVGRINGSRVIAYCTDGTRMGGALGALGSRQIIAAIESAVRERIPVVGVWHSGGAKLADGVEAMNGVGRMFGGGRPGRGRCRVWPCAN
jgi:acetyl-CoA/propionyl-CoA carboxylase carboxyl transferase subunit